MKKSVLVTAVALGCAAVAPAVAASHQDGLTFVHDLLVDDKAVADRHGSSSTRFEWWDDSKKADIELDDREHDLLSWLQGQRPSSGLSEPKSAGLFAAYWIGTQLLTDSRCFVHPNSENCNTSFRMILLTREPELLSAYSAAMRKLRLPYPQRSFLDSVIYSEFSDTELGIQMVNTYLSLSYAVPSEMRTLKSNWSDRPLSEVQLATDKWLEHKEASPWRDDEERADIFLVFWAAQHFSHADYGCAKVIDWDGNKCTNAIQRALNSSYASFLVDYGEARAAYGLPAGYVAQQVIDKWVPRP